MDRPNASGTLFWGQAPEWAASISKQNFVNFVDGNVILDIKSARIGRLRYIDALGKDQCVIYQGFLMEAIHMISLTSLQWSDRLMYRTILEVDGKVLWTGKASEKREL